MKLRNALIVYTTPRSHEQKNALENIKSIVRKYIPFSTANRDKLEKKQFEGRNIIIAVGGDGTFLRAAQFTDSQPILGVNADVKSKEGFFMKANKDNLEPKL